MDAVMKYRGRLVTHQNVEYMRALIASRPDASRYALSKEVCREWGWAQANGALCDGVCRSMMLALHRSGHIELPPPRWELKRPMARHRRPALVEVDQSLVRCKLGALGPLRIDQVRRTTHESLCNSLISEHHYLGYTRPVGEHLKVLVWSGERVVACFVWQSAPRHLGPRDRYIGWDATARRANIRFVVYNSRFLVMPWVEVPHLASHLLGRMVRMLPGEWQRIYGHPVYFAETFVDPSRYRGTCYRAANWVDLGQTTGRGKDDQTKRANRPLKDVLGYPLHRRFKALLSERS